MPYNNKCNRGWCRIHPGTSEHSVNENIPEVKSDTKPDIKTTEIEDDVDPNQKYMFVIKNKNERYDDSNIGIFPTEADAQNVTDRLNYARKIHSDDDWKEFEFYYICIPYYESTSEFVVDEVSESEE